VMELVEGQSLKDLIRQDRVPVPFGLHLLCDVLAGLNYAHQRGIIHRDISPSNIIVTDGGEAKLMDFGLSKAVQAEPGVQSGVVLGTVYYCSPEQVKGSTNLDARSDIYSLGVVLYEVVAGRRPFHSDTPFNIMKDHVESVPVPPVEVDPSVPQALSNVVLKAIAKDPRDRFQTAGEFRQALDGVLGTLGQASVRRIPKTPFWRSLAADSSRLLANRSVLAGLVTLGLAFPATVVWVNAAGYNAATLELPPVALQTPSVPDYALELSKPVEQVEEEALPAPEVPAKSADASERTSKPTATRGNNARPAVVRILNAEPAETAAPPVRVEFKATASAPAPVVAPAQRPQQHIAEPKIAAPVPTETAQADTPGAQTSAAPVTAEPLPRKGLRGFFAKMFHHKKKTAEPVSAFAEPAKHDDGGR